MHLAISEGIINVSSIQDQIDMKEAEKILSNHKYSIWKGKNGCWYTYLSDEKKGKVLKKRSCEDKIKKLVVDYYKALKTDPTFKSIFDSWTLSKLDLGEISRSTYDRYYDDYKRFIENQEIELMKMKVITESYLEDFIKRSIQKHKLTSKGYSNLRLLLRGVLKYAKKRGITQISSYEFFGDLELSKTSFRKNIVVKEKQVFSEEEIDKISKYLISNPCIQNLGILLTFQTGLRVGELCTLKYDDITNQQLHVQRTETKYRDPVTGRQTRHVKEFPKSDAGDRYVFLTPKALMILKKIREINHGNNFIFVKNGKRIYESSFDYYIKKACLECGVVVKSMHKIRKTYGTTLLDGNVDECIIMEQMGHSDINCTKQYYYFSNKNDAKKEQQLRKALDN